MSRLSSSNVSFSSPTQSRLAKTKKPLSQFHQLSTAVKQLQRDAQEQLTLEYESQATFEYLNGQVAALQKAFTTLSEVVMEEVDSIRAEGTKRWRDLELQLSRHMKNFTDLQNEVSLVKRTLDVWDAKERDWAKDTEILKVSHAHNAEWMQQMQRDVMELRDQVQSFKSESALSVKDVKEETAALRQQWNDHVEELNGKLAEYNDGFEKTDRELRVHGQQRMDDLELLEKAISTVQKQQMRLRASVDEGQQVTMSDVRQVASRTEAIEAALAAGKMAEADVRRMMKAQELESRERFDNIGRVFKVFADALHIAPPLFATTAAGGGVGGGGRGGVSGGGAGELGGARSPGGVSSVIR